MVCFSLQTHTLVTYDGKMSGSIRRNGGEVKSSLQWGNSYKTEKERERMNEPYVSQDQRVREVPPAHSVSGIHHAIFFCWWF